MIDLSGDCPVLLCGREFTMQELTDVQKTVRRFPKLSQRELALTICEHLEWFSPNGRLKVESCMQLLKKLEDSGLIVLPAKNEKLVHKSKELLILTTETNNPAAIDGLLADLLSIELKPVRSQKDIRLWNEYIERYHPLGYKRPFGSHQRYFIVAPKMPNQPLGCLLFAASAWALSSRDQWIGWSTEQRSQRLHLVINNTRFLIFPWVKIKNLASKSLSLAVRRIGSDWQTRYGYAPVLLETFVDKEQYRGTCYQAANWIYLGETTGRGRMDRYSEYLSTPKKVYVYPLAKDFREQLCHEGRCDND